MDLSIKSSNFHISQLADDTKIYGIVNNREHAMDLQIVINKFKCWADENHLELNAKKTVCVSFANNKCKHSFLRTYFVGNEEIIEKNQTRDLGVIFDSKLTFDQHIDEIHGRALRAYGAGYRFALETKSDKRLDDVLHKVTRFAIGSSYYNQGDNYVSFEDRLELLRMVNTKERRKYLEIMMAVKIIKGEMRTTLREQMKADLNQSPLLTRRPQIFNIKRNRPEKSPLVNFMKLINDNRLRFDFGDNTESIRRSLKNEILRL